MKILTLIGNKMLQDQLQRSHLCQHSEFFQFCLEENQNIILEKLLSFFNY